MDFYPAGNKLSSEWVLTQFTDAHMHHRVLTLKGIRGA